MKIKWWLHQLHEYQVGCMFYTVLCRICFNSKSFGAIFVNSLILPSICLIVTGVKFALNVCVWVSEEMSVIDKICNISSSSSLQVLKSHCYLILTYVCCNFHNKYTMDYCQFEICIRFDSVYDVNNQAPPHRNYIRTSKQLTRAIEQF